MGVEFNGTGIEAALHRVQLNGWLVNKLEKGSSGVEICEGPGGTTGCIGHWGGGDKIGNWKREWCQLRGKWLHFFSSNESVEKGKEEGSEKKLALKRVRAWEERYGKVYDKGFLVDVEGGEVLIAR